MARKLRQKLGEILVAAKAVGEDKVKAALDTARGTGKRVGEVLIEMGACSEEDVAKAHKYAIESFAAELLPVRDSLEATLAAENATLDALKSGVELTLKQLATVFEKSNLKEVNPVGEKFDPHRHQAISMLPSDREPNTVINVLQKGYLLNDRVVRPALVTVAKGKDA